MADMRLIVAGAGGRMGRALVRVISETPGAVLAGALEAPGSELLGKDSGVLAGLPANGFGAAEHDMMNELRFRLAVPLTVLVPANRPSG